MQKAAQSRGLQLSSIGAPTEAVIAECGGKAAAPVPFAVEGFATAEWREVSSGNGSLAFKPKDLTWERARFSVSLNAGRTSCQGKLELDLDAQRFVFSFESPREFAKVLEAGRAAAES